MGKYSGHRLATRPELDNTFRTDSTKRQDAMINTQQISLFFFNFNISSFWVFRRVLNKHPSIWRRKALLAISYFALIIIAEGGFHHVKLDHSSDQFSPHEQVPTVNKHRAYVTGRKMNWQVQGIGWAKVRRASPSSMARWSSVTFSCRSGAFRLLCCRRHMLPLHRRLNSIFFGKAMAQRR